MMYQLLDWVDKQKKCDKLLCKKYIIIIII